MADLPHREPPVLTVVAIRDDPRGKRYAVHVGASQVELLLTTHALLRADRWRLETVEILRTLLRPEEVLRGHHDRFIAQRRMGQYVTRVVYERESGLPVVLTVYRPRATRYFCGGDTHEDRILP